MQAIYSEADKNRLRWRSRRGLLELDLVFERFLEHDFDQMSAADLDIYQDLLMLPDNDLLDLVDGKTDTDEPRFIPLVARLRHWQVQDQGAVDDSLPVAPVRFLGQD